MVAPAADKGPEAFRTISEAATELGVPQHVLRFWETKFSFIRPMKRAGGRRFYRKQDIAVLKGVRTLLHEEGYTIKGVQRLHKEYGMGRLIGAGEGEAPPSLARPPVVPSAPMADFDDEDPEVTLQEIARVMGVHRAAAEAAEQAQPAFDTEVEPEPEPPQPRPASILRTDARNRLETVLRDIEGVKAGIDRLLADTED